MWESLLNNSANNENSGGGRTGGSGNGGAANDFAQASARLRADSQASINFMQEQGQIGRERMIAAAEQRNKTSGLNMMINTGRTCWQNAEQIAR